MNINNAYVYIKIKGIPRTINDDGIYIIIYNIQEAEDKTTTITNGETYRFG